MVVASDYLPFGWTSPWIAATKCIDSPRLETTSTTFSMLVSLGIVAHASSVGEWPEIKAIKNTDRTSEGRLMALAPARPK